MARNVLSVFIDTNIWVQSFPRYLCINLHNSAACYAWYSDEVIKETRRILLKELSEEKTDEAIAHIQEGLPYSKIEVADLEDRYSMIDLPDVNDRHVLYAAVLAKSDFLVTDDKGDFQAEYLNRPRNHHLRLPKNFQALTLDNFLCRLLNQNETLFIKALIKTLLPMKRDTTEEQLWKFRIACNCPETHDRLKPNIAYIAEVVQSGRMLS